MSLGTRIAQKATWRSPENRSRALTSNFPSTTSHITSLANIAMLCRARRPPRLLLLAGCRTSAFACNRRSLVTLAIETSCDDTAVAVLSHTGPSTELLFNERISSDNRAFQGIAPNITVHGHQTTLAAMVQRACRHLPASKPDFVSATRGPGIKTNLSVGLTLAKGLAVAWDVPLVGVHHMQAHALTPRLFNALSSSSSSSSSSSPTPDFPFLTLLVSGGHTELVHSRSLLSHSIIARTRDNAIGNVLDQTARVLLPSSVLDAAKDVMYGRELESFAFPNGASDYSFFTPASSRGAEMVDAPSGYDWTVPIPLRDSRQLAYSYAGIHSTVHKIAASRPHMDTEERRALARHTLRAAFQHLVGRACVALDDVQGLADAKTLVVAGGVASNKFLMHVLRTTLDVRGYADMQIVAPPPWLCTDNAPMIAWAGMEMFRAGFTTGLGAVPLSKWPMDPEVGCGLLGVDDWIKGDPIVD